MKIVDATGAVLKRKFIELNACIKQRRKSQTNDLSLHIKKLEKKKSKLNQKKTQERK